MSDPPERGDLKRRGFLRGLILALSGALAAAAGTAFFIRGRQRSGRKPNIIFILADDLGFGDLGSYGQERIQTPNLDRLASEGMRFTQYYAGSSVCAPSRASLLTGQHTGHTFIRHNTTRNKVRIALRPEDFTVAELLKGGGYTTGLVGKWGLGDGSTGTPNQKGFDHFVGLINEGGSPYYPAFVWRNGDQEWIEANRDGSQGTYSQDLYTQEALQFIEEHRREPFFLYLAYDIPHAGDAPGSDNDMEVPDDEPYAQQDWPQPEKNFAAMITRMDRDIGQIVSRLEALGLDKNTVVFFSSDNGPHKEGGHSHKFFNSSGPLKGIKRRLFEGGIRVPMIAWWPGVVRTGSLTEQAWAFWDFLPTAAELAGVEVPDDVALDGISMRPALLGEPHENHEFLYWELPDKGRFDQAVRMGDWKGVRLREYQADIELYNLLEDPGEEHDVAAEHPEIVAQIARIMEAEHTPSEEFPVPTES